MFSGLILIGRGLNHKMEKKTKKIVEIYYLVLSESSKEKKKRSGGNGMMEIPVPIPNTEVKHHNGEDSTKVRQ